MWETRDFWWHIPNLPMGFRMDVSDGRGKNLLGKWFVFAPPGVIDQRLPYEEWRVIIRAWKWAEAMEAIAADKRVEKLYRRVWNAEFNAMISYG